MQRSNQQIGKFMLFGNNIPLPEECTSLLQQRAERRYEAALQHQDRYVENEQSNVLRISTRRSRPYSSTSTDASLLPVHIPAATSYKSKPPLRRRNSFMFRRRPVASHRTLSLPDPVILYINEIPAFYLWF